MRWEKIHFVEYFFSLRENWENVGSHKFCYEPVLHENDPNE